LKEPDQNADDKQSTGGGGGAGALSCLNDLPSTSIVVPDLSAVRKYVVRPAPIPPPPRYLQTTSGSNHPLEHGLWVRIFTLLDPADLVRGFVSLLNLSK